MQEKLENVYDKAIFVLFAGHVLFAAVLVHKDKRSFNLHLDFWKSRSWEIKVCFNP